MRSLILSSMWIWLGLGLAACVDYGGSDAESCQGLLDCNPNRTCGQMTLCVDGECDRQSVSIVPCAQVCQLDEDCPEGMHCVWGSLSSDNGYCRLDGICDSSDECWDYAERGDCQGAFLCEVARCRWTCDIRS